MPRTPQPIPPLHPLAHVVVDLARRRAEVQQIRPHVAGFDELDLANALGAALCGGFPTPRLWNAYKAVAKHILTTMHARGGLTRDPAGWYRLADPADHDQSATQQQEATCTPPRKH